jgi:hypothetical protein
VCKNKTAIFAKTISMLWCNNIGLVCSKWNHSEWRICNKNMLWSNCTKYTILVKLLIIESCDLFILQFVTSIYFGNRLELNYKYTIYKKRWKKLKLKKEFQIHTQFKNPQLTLWILILILIQLFSISTVYDS